MLSVEKVEVRAPVSVARLIVLVSAPIENTAELARQVYGLVNAQACEVLYIAIRPDLNEDLAAARSLATLQALTQASDIPTHALQLNTGRWIDSLAEIVQPGDVVVCPAQLVRSAGEALQTRVGVTVQVLPGTQVLPTKDWMRAAVFWLSGLVILVGFTLLEFRMALLLSGGLMKVVLIALVVLELSALALWDRIFG